MGPVSEREVSLAGTDHVNVTSWALRGPNINAKISPSSQLDSKATPTRATPRTGTRGDVFDPPNRDEDERFLLHSQPLRQTASHSGLQGVECTDGVYQVGDLHLVPRNCARP